MLYCRTKNSSNSRNLQWNLVNCLAFQMLISILLSNLKLEHLSPPTASPPINTHAQERFEPFHPHFHPAYSAVFSLKRVFSPFRSELSTLWVSSSSFLIKPEFENGFLFSKTERFDYSESSRSPSTPSESGCAKWCCSAHWNDVQKVLACLNLERWHWCAYFDVWMC